MKVIITGFLLITMLALPAPGYADQWIQRPGLATDIGIGGDGSVWVIGTHHVGTGFDFGIHRWILTNSTWEDINGGGVRIDVDENGNPWIVNSKNQIFHRLNDNWVQLPGLATDVGVGADGSVWIIGTNPVGSGKDLGVHRWTGSAWEAVDGGGIRIDVDDNGNPWIVNSRNQIFHRSDNQWVQLPGLAKDIGVGSDNVWIIGTNPVGDGYDFGVHRWTGSTWQAFDGGGVQIAVGFPGLPWIVNSKGNIFQRVQIK